MDSYISRRIFLLTFPSICSTSVRKYEFVSKLMQCQHHCISLVWWFELLPHRKWVQIFRPPLKTPTYCCRSWSRTRAQG